MQVVFIDKISMVGSGIFNFLDLRLQQIMGTKEPFGDLSIITVGDLFQPKPVFDQLIFENTKDGYTTLATNVSVVDGMTDGTECINVHVCVPGSTRPSIIWVLFQEEHNGKDYRKEYSHLYNQSIDRHWVPILKVTRYFRRHQMQVLHRQCPLRLSAAKTIHRCQGDTLDEDG